MQRINTANAAANLFGVGKNGFQGGNPAANLPATFLSPEWCNSIQEELARAIEGLGVALNSGSNTQLLDALVAYFTPRSLFAGEIGKVSYVPATAASVNHVPVFGVELVRASYPDLWAFAQASGALVDETVFGTSRPGCFSYGPGGVNGTTFRVPKIPGLVIKSYHNGDSTWTTNVTAAIGEYLPDVVKAHAHDFYASETSTDGTAPDVERLTGYHQGTYQTSTVGGPENTVRSVVLFPQIRAR